ncbi:pyruvate dehydrogenase (acetyl-transferring) E1 component subunit alpha [Pseudonocardia asaccharolytica]|uniref:Putative pyruvate dehydrogenase E1 component, alpha subunit n=1 Tax=Pseudonocardia asaccharolytica DSM 44247 = NBRC 16224 TaxID=1123024 RepID=A0A511D613_9PSEU|nr:pyruvate dehydrogenase (acetyl-transferring) E1 component subunit alpha [Pseudonocardia asaccharolytica]GEL20229.1 putative pyruvate dehydrogenase E1 component, alpha subunit [Pseudonocardia asaccharolytica DSM 44247 = NBRC 16224]
MSTSLAVDGVVQLVDEHGHAADPAVLPPTAELLAGYRAMVLARRLNEQAGALVRQGRLAVYPSSHGQEACQVAAVSVLREDDWLFPTYRDTAAVAARGVDPVEALVLLRGDWHCGYDPTAHRVAPQATPLATQLLHAVGVGHAARLRGEDTVVMALCGDGATSEGDFHEACNFAAVFAAPVVFLVQNNKYAISVPLARQSVAPSLAAKGAGYGMPAVLVDGNDLAALSVTLSDAVRRARDGDGPTLVEADTYRVAAHTNADDPARYRTEDEVARWLPRDPLARLRTYLIAEGVLDDAREAEFAAAADEMAAHVRHGVSAEDVVDPAELFAHVYARPTAQLAEQEALLRAELTEEAAR